MSKFFSNKLSYYLFDWANSPFSTVIITFVFSSYFVNNIAKDKIVGTSLWGWTIAISGLAISLLGPFLGYLGDKKKYFAKRFLFLSTLIIFILCNSLWFSEPTQRFTAFTLLIIFFSNTLFELSQVFYNSQLLNYSKGTNLGAFSGKAWSYGYLGGIFCLIILLIFFILPENNFFSFNKQEYKHIRICGPIVGLWYLLFSLPFLISFRQEVYRSSINFGIFIKNIVFSPKDKNTIKFLIARMVYTDGLITLFSFGGIYAMGTFNFNFSEIIFFGIAINITAAIGAFILGHAEDNIGKKKVLLISLFALILISFLTLIIKEKTIFWILGVSIGFFIGSIQSTSRTSLVGLTSKKDLNKMFGLYAFTGKATNFLGPFLVATMTTIFDSQRAGMASILIFLCVGTFLLYRTNLK